MKVGVAYMGISVSIHLKGELGWTIDKQLQVINIMFFS